MNIILIISAALLFLSGFCFGRAYEAWAAYKKFKGLVDGGGNLWDAQ